MQSSYSVFEVDYFEWFSHPLFELRLYVNKCYRLIEWYGLLLDPRSEGPMKYPLSICSLVSLPVSPEFFTRSARRRFLFFRVILGCHLAQRVMETDCLKKSRFGVQKWSFSCFMKNQCMIILQIFCMKLP